jgi:hypothetical protein
VTVVQVVLAALIVLVVWAMCAVMHWDVREECEYQAGLDELWDDEDTLERLGGRRVGSPATRKRVAQAATMIRSGEAGQPDGEESAPTGYFHEVYDWGREGRAG